MSKNKVVKKQEDIHETPESDDIDRRIDLLSLVIRDLQTEYEIAHSEQGRCEHEAETHAALDTVAHLISEAAHIAAHGLNFKSITDYHRLMRDLLESSMQGVMECVSVVPAENLTEEDRKQLS